MGVAAMLVMDVAGIMIVVLVPLVMMVMVVRMAMIVAMVMRRGQGRHRPAGLQRAHEPAALGPDQPGAERRDQAIACEIGRASCRERVSLNV